ncbi:hypothetical protein [Roseateles sp.]|uniref:hypothetical protein n=1 Tax=Roseateles sp. TaxID=1971397 RepID=UPI003BA5D574
MAPRRSKVILDRRQRNEDTTTPALRRRGAAGLLAISGVPAAAANIDLNDKAFGINYWYFNAGTWNKNDKQSTESGYMPLPSALTPWLTP